MNKIINKTKVFTLLSTKPFSSQSKQLFYASNKFLSDKIIRANDYDSFKKQLTDADKPIIVDFYASWCGPCKMLTPKLEEAIESQSDFKLLKVNIDQVTDAAVEHKVSSVPTVIAFHKGEPVHSFIGFQNTQGILKFFEQVKEKI